MVIYSRFGDRYGLEEALLHRATDSLTDVVGATGSPGDVSVENCCVAIREWAHSNPARFSMLFLTSHLLDTGLHDMARQSARAAAKVVATQVGWQDDDDSRAMSLIAALVGFLGFELRGELPGNTAEAFTRLARSLASLHTTSHR